MGRSVHVQASGLTSGERISPSYSMKYWVLIVVLIIVVLFFGKSGEDIVIVSSHFNEDIEWLRDSPYDVVIMDKEGSAEHTVPSSPKYTVTKTMNLGRESSAYLQFIVDNYDKLPDYMAFIHGHETAWHQARPILDAIRLGRWRDHKEYYSLNTRCTNDWDMNDPDFGGHSARFVREMWDELFKDLLGPKPTRLSSACCAQFITTREAIRRIPLATWTKWRDFCFSREHLDHDGGYMAGICFEFTWHMTLGQHPAVYGQGCNFKEDGLL